MCAQAMKVTLQARKKIFTAIKVWERTQHTDFVPVKTSGTKGCGRVCIGCICRGHLISDLNTSIGGQELYVSSETQSYDAVGDKFLYVSQGLGMMYV